MRGDVQSQLQKTGQFSAQVQAHAGGAAPGPAIAAGKAPVEDTGQLMGGNPNSVVLNGELDLLSERPGGDGDNRVLAPVAGGVLEKLAQEKGGPFPIGLDKAAQPLHFYPNAALDEEGSVVSYGLGNNLLQVGLTDYTVPFRALRTGIE